MLLSALLAGFATFPLLQPYFVASSDGLFHLFRLMEYDHAFKDGVWYPRWASDFYFGLGMPIFNFYGPLTYYLADVFHLLGAGYIDSLRLFVAAMLALSGLGAFLYARTFFSPAPALLVAVVYMYAPYHLVNLYYRGDIAEYSAYTWFPFILWAISRLLQRKSPIYFLAGALFYAALILTHNLSAFIFSGFLIVYSIAAIARQHVNRPIEWRRVLTDVLRLGAMAAAGWALTAFFWLPALVEKSLVNFDRLLFYYNFAKYFPTIEQLLSTDFIHRYGVVFLNSDIYGYKLGLLQAIFLVIGLAVLVWRRKRFDVGLRIEAAASVIVAAASLFFIFPISIWLWQNAPLLNLTQFPWRFLAFIGLPAAILAGAIVEAIPGRLRAPAIVALSAMVIVSSVARMSPIMSGIKEADVSPKGSIEFELTYGAIGTSAAAEYLPVWVKQRAANSPYALATVLGEDTTAFAGRTSPDMEATLQEKKAERATYLVHAAKAGIFVPGILYFPGWVAQIDGKQVPTAIDDPTGLISIQVPAGEHTIALRFVETPLRQAADGISVVALLILLGAMAFVFLKRRSAAGMVDCQSPLKTGRQFAIRATLAKAVIVLAIGLSWLLARSLYDSAYSLPATRQYPMVANLGNEVLVKGYDLPANGPSGGSSVHVRPGTSLPVSVFWRLIGTDETKHYRPFIRLTNTFNQTWAYAQSAVDYPNLDLPHSREITTTLDLAIPPGTPPGAYQIEVGFASGAAQQPLEVRQVLVSPILPSGKVVRTAPIIVDRSTTTVLASSGPAPLPALAQAASFGGQLRLLNLALTDAEALSSGKPGDPLPKDDSGSWQIRAGEIVHFDLLWQALQEIGEDYTITAHLVSSDGNVWAIRDSQPADGTYPTTFWAKDEIVHDQLNLKIPAETPPGRYELEIEVVGRSGPVSLLDANHVPIGPAMRIGNLSVSPAAQPAEPQRIVMQHVIDKQIVGDLSIAGYSLGRKELQPGDSLNLDVLWQATGSLRQDLETRLELLDSSGKAWATESSRPGGDAYPTTSWRPGEVLRAKYDLTLQAGAPQGQASLRIEAIDAASGQIVGALTLDHVRILPRTRSFTANPSRPLMKILDGKIRLLGYDLANGPTKLADQMPSVTAANTLGVTLYWQALTEMNTSYTVFTQVIDAKGKLVAQNDSPPQSGKAPTTGWLRDEVVSDEHVIHLPTDLPLGHYTIITGIYDAATGQRLSVEGGGDFITLTPLSVITANRTNGQSK